MTDFHNAPLADGTDQPVVGLAAFESALVRHGVVQAAAVDDSTNYDEGRTSEAILKAYEDTMQRVEHDRFNLWCLINEVATWLTSINEFERAAQLFGAINRFKSNK